MDKPKFQWNYLAGLKMASIAVRKYRDEATGAIKEELLKHRDKAPETLYYIPGDKYTFTSENELIKRINTCENTKQ